MSHTNLNYHVIFSTKERRPFLDDMVKPRLYQYIGGIIRNTKSVLLDAGWTQDHLHLATGIHPTFSVSDFVRTVKCNSTRWIHETFPALRGFQWQDEYSAFTVSESIMPKVIEYARDQLTHHQNATFVQELKMLLGRHGVKYDERYL